MTYSFYYIIHQTNNVLVNLPYYQNDHIFNEWLAGIIDGDGHFRVDTNTSPILIIELSGKNMTLLSLIQSKIGGNINPTSRNKVSLRFTLSKRADFINLIHRVNGHIRNSIRLIQFNKICSYYEIQPLDTIPLTTDNAWFTGFFDADGSIYARFNHKPCIFIQVTNKYVNDLTMFNSFFSGNIYDTKTVHPCYRWMIGSREDILKLHSYFMKFPPMSHKLHRIVMIPEFYHLIDSKAHKDINQSNLWSNFVSNWKLNVQKDIM